MAKIAVLTLHGIGATFKDYAAPVQTRLAERLGPDGPDIALESVYYQEMFQPKQRAVLRRSFSHAPLAYEEDRRLALAGMADVLALECKKECSGSAYERAQLEIARKLLAARDRMADSGSVVVLTHSLGCHVLSNYLYDAQQPPGTVRAGIWRDIDRSAVDIAGHCLSEDEKAFLRGGAIDCWISTACNIPVFVAVGDRMEIKPIRAPSEAFRWLNFYHPEDASAWPLRPLGSGYEVLVEDTAITTAADAKPPSASSLQGYWSSPQVLDALTAACERLAAERSVAVD